MVETPPSHPVALRHVLVTGGAGFIGSHLCRHLLRAGLRVTVVDDLSTGSASNLGPILDHPEFRWTADNVLDEEAVERAMEGTDAVVHLAAAVGVRKILAEPVESLETNVAGTATVLRVAARNGCRRLVLASTSEVYGKGIRIPFHEDDDVVLGSTVRRRWSYAAGKMVDEFLALAYHEEGRLDTTVVRLFNTVGPGQVGHYGMVLPRFIDQALRNEPITVYGDGTQTRCFCHVVDVAEALLGLLDHPGASGAVLNVGSEEEVAIGDLARKVCELTASRSPIVRIPFQEAYGPGFEDMERRVPNTRRVRELLGWAPRHTLNDIIRSILEHRRRARGDTPFA